MKSFEYYQLRAGGLGIVIGLSAVWATLVAVVVVLASRDREWALVVALPIWAAVIALIYGTPLGRWIGRSVQSTAAVFFLFGAAVIPYYLFVWPARKLATVRGWIVEIEGE